MWSAQEPAWDPFTGEFEHTIDDKNRLSVPAAIRSLASDGRDMKQWYAVPWLPSSGPGLIRLYLAADFKELSAALPRSLMPGEDDSEGRATLFGLSARMEMDASNRVRLPEGMLEMLGLTREVVIIGAHDHLEVRDRAAWKQSKVERLRRLREAIQRGQSAGP